VHAAWSGSSIALPSLVDRLDEAMGLLQSGDLDRVLDHRSAGVLIDVIGGGVERVRGHAAIIHGEPHDGNFVVHNSRVLVIDFEAVCLGPTEWDAAFFPDDVVAREWPELDRELVGHCRTLVSATVSTYCWRHLAARGEDAEMRSQAQSHLLLAIGQAE
jgi:hypothetical protein